MAINEVIINGQTVLSTRGDSVNESNLVQDETATNSAGEKIVGELDPVSHEELNKVQEQVDELDENVGNLTAEINNIGSDVDNIKDDAYMVSDSEGEIADDDYIPFNDVSDSEMPKKKTLFSAIMDKFKKSFVTLTGDNITDVNTFKSNIKTVEYVGIAIPSGADLNDYTEAGNYAIPTDAIAKTLVNCPVDLCGKLVVFINGNSGISQLILANHNPKIYYRTKFGDTWYNWIDITEGGSGDGYSPSDSVGTLDNSDYIPFNDVSDTTAPKKKILFSSVVEKLKDTFLPKSWGHVELTQNSEYLQIKDNQVDATASDNSVTSTHYPTSDRMVDKNGKTITVFESVVNASGNIGAKMYARNYDTEGNSVGQNDFEVDVDKSGNFTYQVSDPHNFRKAINTVEQLGTKIPANSDLDDYTQAGVYWVGTNNDATTINNIPIKYSGKLIVSYITDGNINKSNWKSQIYIPNHEPKIFQRVAGASGWLSWVEYATTSDISPSTIGNGYAVATVSGSAITATITGFQLRAGVIVAIHIPNEVTVDCTLNISSTGTKSIRTWNSEAINFGYPLSIGIHIFIYDGTYYRIIAQNRVPFVSAQSYVADTRGNILIDWGYGSNRAQIKYDIHDNKLRWNYYKNSAWRGDVKIADYDDLLSALAKVGKNILSIWSYTTNTYTNNGITYTFNPSTGEITANGTATADSACIMFSYKNNGGGYIVQKGTYILSGCPSGGSTSTYYIRFQYIDRTTNVESSITDTGNGITATFSNDVSDNGTSTNYFIRVVKGTTVSNLVFKPMLRPSWTTSTYEPCEDIHKGNCYVGTCTTAAGTKDKVAYVDGYFVLRKGVRVAVKFTNTNTYSSSTSNPITLNVNGTGAKNIWYWQTHSGAGNTGANATLYGYANRYTNYYYDGTYWVWDGMSGEANDNNRKSFYGTCATEAGTSAKVVTISDTNGWELRAGTMIGIKFTNSNTASNVTLNVNNSGAKSIYYNNAVYTGNANSVCGYANRTTYYMYNGSQWVFLAQGVTNSDTYTSAYCSTAGGTAAKTATCSGYALLSKSHLHIIMTTANTVQGAITLNVNGKGAKPIYINGNASSASNYALPAGSYLIYYNGTNYYFRTDGKITCAGTVTA